MAAELCNHWTKCTLEMLPQLKGWFISYYSSHFTGEDRATAVSGPALPITCHPNTLMVSLLVSDYTYILESFLLLPVAALHFHTAACILPTMCLGMTVLISINYGHVDGPGHRMDWSSTLQWHDNKSHWHSLYCLQTIAGDQTTVSSSITWHDNNFWWANGTWSTTLVTPPPG